MNTREEIIKRAQELLTCGALSKEACDAIKADFPELAESEDERIRKSIILLLQRGGYMSPEDKDKAFAYLEKQKVQKPAEWSEEDKEMLLSIINAFRNGTVSTIGQEQWLKSLPERFNLQPKAEWSEEDEGMRRLLIAILDTEHPNGVFSTGTSLVEYLKTDCVSAKRIKDWLKSIGPSWKPSDEQN